MMTSWHSQPGISRKLPAEPGVKDKLMMTSWQFWPAISRKLPVAPALRQIPTCESPEASRFHRLEPIPFMPLPQNPIKQRLPFGASLPSPPQLPGPVPTEQACATRYLEESGSSGTSQTSAPGRNMQIWSLRKETQIPEGPPRHHSPPGCHLTHSLVQ